MPGSCGEWVGGEGKEGVERGEERDRRERGAVCERSSAWEGREEDGVCSVIELDGIYTFVGH